MELQIRRCRFGMDSVQAAPRSNRALTPRAHPIVFASTMPTTANTKKRGPASPASKWIRFGITMILGIFIVAVVRYILVRGAETREFNAIINELVDQQKYEEAIPRLEKLMETAQGSVRDAARTQ